MKQGLPGSGDSGYPVAAFFDNLPRLPTPNELKFLRACLERMMALNDARIHGTITIWLREGRCDLIASEEKYKEKDL